jgi:hypothetical protein
MASPAGGSPELPDCPRCAGVAADVQRGAATGQIEKGEARSRETLRQRDREAR